MSRPGSTLVEFLVVAVLATVVVGGAYEVLVVQERSHAAASSAMDDQEALRAAVAVLETELREIGSIGGDTIGGTDILEAGSGTMTFRAQRKIGFICELSSDDRWLRVWSPGEPFETGDELLVFIDGDSLTYFDDRWDTAFVDDASDDSDASCQSAWPDVPLQVLRLPSSDDPTLGSVRAGSPIRAYERVRYSLQDAGSRGWALARQREGEADADILVAGLAGPGRGLEFEYFAPDGTSTTSEQNVSRVRVTVRADANAQSDRRPAEISANVYLRNN